MSLYPVTCTASTLTIPAANVDAALLAVRALGTQPAGSADGPLWTAPAASSLEEALAGVGWRALPNGRSGVLCLWGGGHALGDTETVLAALAPHVEEGSYVTFVGADGDHWQWTFMGGAMVETYPELRRACVMDRPSSRWLRRLAAMLRRSRGARP